MLTEESIKTLWEGFLWVILGCFLAIVLGIVGIFVVLGIDDLIARIPV